MCSQVVRSGVIPEDPGTFQNSIKRQPAKNSRGSCSTMAILEGPTVYLAGHICDPDLPQVLHWPLPWVLVLSHCFPHVLLPFLQLSTSVSEDMKPLTGLPGVGGLHCTAGSPSSLVRHICAICGDRSSGRGAGSPHPSFLCTPIPCTLARACTCSDAIMIKMGCGQALGAPLWTNCGRTVLGPSPLPGDASCGSW